jgi:hypothetical protein
MEGHSIGIVPHRFAPAQRDLESHGIYNVGWVSFRNDSDGLACLRWWRERCLEWCFDRKEPGRYADQKYLDVWPMRFRGVKVIEHIGANLAPWNVANYTLALTKAGVAVDHRPLVFFHFHGLRRERFWLYALNLGSYAVQPSSVLVRCVYRPYLQALAGLQRRYPSCTPDLPSPRPLGAELTGTRTLFISFLVLFGWRGRLLAGLVRGDYLVSTDLAAVLRRIRHRLLS